MSYKPTDEESAAYFLDKCDAEAGNFREGPPPALRPPRSMWAILWDLFTSIVADMKKPGP